MKYSASLDLTVKITSTIIILIILSTLGFCISEMVSSTNLISLITNLIVILIMLTAVLVCYLFAPVYYELNKDGLIIKRKAKDRKLKFTDIIDVRLMDKVESKGIIRTFGVGGLFGYFGKFVSLKLGAMNWYTTQRKNRILITLNDGEKIVVTPDDTGLIENIRLHIAA